MQEELPNTNFMLPDSDEIDVWNKLGQIPEGENFDVSCPNGSRFHLILFEH